LWVYARQWRRKRQLDKASDVVCLLTPRSLERPWLLYEAGVAKGRLDTPVYGVALGIPLSKASTGPFAQFQNCDDDPESLTKLVMQLVQRIPGSEPDHDAFLMQVQIFKDKATELLSKRGQQDQKEQHAEADNTAIAKMFEEVKVIFRDLPTRVESALTDGERPVRKRRIFIDPIVLDDMSMFGQRLGNPAMGILVLASLLREETFGSAEELVQFLKNMAEQESECDQSATCRYCGDAYDGRFADATSGRCPACALEADYGDVSASISSVLSRNDRAADVRERYHDSMPEGQRSGKRRTDGG
jgi:hypothetical protein